MKRVTFLFLTVISMVLFCTVYAQSTEDEFQKAVAAYQQAPNPSGAEKVIKLAVVMDKLPSVPEEARKHFVKGAALFKEAKSPADFTQVLDEFKEAARLAPGWPEARYNFALACESAGEYPSAMANLKLYQLFKLPDAEARAVQDKIYVLEAKQEKVAKGTSPEVVVERKQNNDADLIKSLDGVRFTYQSNSGSGVIVDLALDIRGTTLIFKTCIRQKPPEVIMDNPVGVWVELSQMQIIGRRAEFTRPGYSWGTFIISEDGKSIAWQPQGGEAYTYYREK